MNAAVQETCSGLEGSIAPRTSLHNLTVTSTIFSMARVLLWDAPKTRRLPRKPFGSACGSLNGYPGLSPVQYRLSSWLKTGLAIEHRPAAWISGARFTALWPPGTMLDSNSRPLVTN